MEKCTKTARAEIHEIAARHGWKMTPQDHPVFSEKVDNLPVLDARTAGDEGYLSVNGC